MTTAPAQPFKDPAMNPLTPRKIAQLRRIAEDAADNHEIGRASCRERV